jgi:hypothetical protein
MCYTEHRGVHELAVLELALVVLSSRMVIILNL